MAFWRYYSFLFCLFLGPALPADAATEVHPADWPALKSSVPVQADIEKSVQQLLLPRRRLSTLSCHWFRLTETVVSVKEIEL